MDADTSGIDGGGMLTASVDVDQASFVRLPWHVRHPVAYATGVWVASAAIVGGAVLGIVDFQSVSAQTTVSSQAQSLNSQGTSNAGQIDQAAVVFDGQISTVRAAVREWTPALLAGLVPVAGAAPVATLRTDLAALAKAAAVQIPTVTWHDVSTSGGSADAALARARTRLAAVRTLDGKAEAASAALSQAQSTVDIDLRALGTALTAQEPAVLAAHPAAFGAAQTAFSTAVKAAAAAPTAADAQAVLAAYTALARP